MSFILTDQRDANGVESFRRYREYVAASHQVFPRGGYALAVSDWYFDPRCHRCPHDSWLENITVSEPSTGKCAEQRITSIRMRLFGAYQNGFIEFFYPRVFSYSFHGLSCSKGHSDWQYDEFRISSDGYLIHEIEWAGFSQGKGSRWIIEASDVEFTWIPTKELTSKII